MKSYETSEKKQRAINRLAEIFFDHWQEGRVGSSRIFEHVVPDEWTIGGRSSSGGTYREHIVPCALIRDHAIKMYTGGSNINDVSKMIDEHLIIILISDDERNLIDNKLNLKTTMPDGWEFGNSDPFARLTLAGINLIKSQ